MEGEKGYTLGMGQQYKLPIKLKGTLIDIETTGLNPDTDELVTFGAITGSRLYIIQRTGEEAKDFLNRIRKEVENCQSPFYAYYCPFESKWLDIPLSRWQEIQPYEYAKKEDMISISQEVRKDSLHTGKRVPEFWNRYLRLRDDHPQEAANILQKIMEHNKTCLLKELSLLVCRDIREEVREDGN